METADRSRTSLIAALLCVTGTCIAQTDAAPAAAPQPCTQAPATQGASRQVFRSTAFVVLMTELEAQGEKNFQPRFDTPGPGCLLEEFTVGDSTVSALHVPWVAGMQTLHYRFTAATGGDKRDVLVLYNGMVGMMALKGPCFYVVETRNGETSYYAMYGEQPAYEAVKQLASAVIDGSARPLVTVKWPPGAREPEVVEWDIRRLK